MKLKNSILKLTALSIIFFCTKNYAVNSLSDTQTSNQQGKTPQRKYENYELLNFICEQKMEDSEFNKNDFKNIAVLYSWIEDIENRIHQAGFFLKPTKDSKGKEYQDTWSEERVLKLILKNMIKYLYRVDYKVTNSNQLKKTDIENKKLDDQSKEDISNAISDVNTIYKFNKEEHEKGEIVILKSKRAASEIKKTLTEEEKKFYITFRGNLDMSYEKTLTQQKSNIILDIKNNLYTRNQKFKEYFDLVRKNKLPVINTPQNNEDKFLMLTKIIIKESMLEHISDLKRLYIDIKENKLKDQTSVQEFIYAIKNNVNLINGIIRSISSKNSKINVLQSEIVDNNETDNNLSTFRIVTKNDNPYVDPIQYIGFMQSSIDDNIRNTWQIIKSKPTVEINTIFNILRKEFLKAKQVSMDEGDKKTLDHVNCLLQKRNTIDMSLQINRLLRQFKKDNIDIEKHRLYVFEGSNGNKGFKGEKEGDCKTTEYYLDPEYTKPL